MRSFVGNQSAFKDRSNWRRDFFAFSRKPIEKHWCAEHVSDWVMTFKQCQTAYQMKRQNMEVAPCRKGE